MNRRPNPARTAISTCPRKQTGLFPIFFQLPISEKYLKIPCKADLSVFYQIWAKAGEIRMFIMRFTKMHGIGNDYVYVNGFEERVSDPKKLAISVSDRHFGIGSDGLILILPAENADVRMRMFNADGSESEMCGNGVRCVAKFAIDHGLAQPRPLVSQIMQKALHAALPGADSLGQIAVQTGRGVLTIGAAIQSRQVQQLCVDMGEPILNPSEIPVAVTGRQAVGIPFELDGRNWLMTCVSMGNPHAVFFCPDVASLDLNRLGPLVEHHKLFPKRINAHFVQRVSNEEVILRTWERGSGITLACGTGAAAVCVAGVLASKTGRQIHAHLPGGDLHLIWSEQDNHVYMTGPAAEVFSGVWPD